jgi:hypothetical protein
VGDVDVSNPLPKPFWKERKNRKKNKNTYKERENLLELVNTRYLLLVGGFWETGGWPAPRNTSQKVSSIRFSLLHKR